MLSYTCESTKGAGEDSCSLCSSWEGLERPVNFELRHQGSLLSALSLMSSVMTLDKSLSLSELSSPICKVES